MVAGQPLDTVRIRLQQARTCRPMPHIHLVPAKMYAVRSCRSVAVVLCDEEAVMSHSPEHHQMGASHAAC